MRSKKSFFLVPIWGFILFIILACLAPVPPVTSTSTPCGLSPQSIYLIPTQIPKDYTDWSQFTQFQALSLFTGQVERWSDYEDIPLNDQATYRITVTLITPELRRAAYVLESLHRHKTSAEISQGLEDISNSALDRDQLRFLITLALKYSGNNLMEVPNKIAVSPGSLVMLDRHGNEVPPSTMEGALLTSFNVVDGPFAAYITYPVFDTKKCEATVDVLADTSVTLTLKQLKIGEREFDVSWIINLSPLVSVGLPTLIANSAASAGGITSTYLEPQTLPPTPNPGDTNFLSLDNYWNELAKFIWSKLSASNSR